jgi:hypothetical protein
MSKNRMDTGNDWPYEMRLRFARLVSLHKGYIKSETNMKDKWTIIMSSMKTMYPHFTLQSPSSTQQHFTRLSEATLKLVGVSDEGANLSGLADVPDEFEKLIICMSEEVDERKYIKKSIKDKNDKIQKGCLTHEIAGLKTQGSFSPFILNSIISPTEDCELIVENTSPTPSKDSVKRGGRTFMDAFGDSISKILEDDSTDPELQRISRERQYFQEDRMFAIEDRKLKFQEEQMLSNERLEGERSKIRIMELEIQKEQNAVMRTLLLNKLQDK